MAVPRACFLVLLLLHGASGQGFLAARSKKHLTSVYDEVRWAISDVLGGGHGINANRMAHIRSTFTPLFRSLPKTRQGHLSEAVMGYAILRYFSQQHGWMMKGFDPHVAAIDGSNITNGGHILQSKVPDFVRSVMEQKLAHGGFSFEDAIVMIATLERLILDEVIEGVELAFDLNNLEATQVLDHGSFLEVLISYVINELIGTDDSITDIKKHQKDKKNIRLRYPHWDETYGFLTDIVSNDIFEYKHARNPFADNSFVFEDAVRISQRLSEEFGPWSNHECNTMKAALSSMDPHETGRVKMSEFYHSTKGGAWQFKEGFEYLRQVGAIDESSEVFGAQVLIPNYITGVNNCITSKRYYSICCLNECDAVYKHLEAAIATDHASVAEIVAVVQGLPQMPDGKNVSNALRERLVDISVLHDGKVPLHGRLFAQWLHFVLPRDCPYPHTVGTLNPLTPGDYEKSVGQGASDTTHEEIEAFLKAESAKIAPSPEAGLQMWNFQEVLLDTVTPMDRVDGSSGGTRSILRICALAGLLGCLAMFVFKESYHILDIVRPEVKAVQYDV